MLKSFFDGLQVWLWPRKTHVSYAAPHLNLATLPLDVIRTIVRVDEGPYDSLGTMRRISRSWNGIVLAHLNRTQGLKQVVLCPATQIGNADKLVHMRAVVPKRCVGKTRIGFGIWTSARRSVVTESVEVFAEQKIGSRNSDKEDLTTALLISTSLGTFLAFLYNMHKNREMRATAYLAVTCRLWMRIIFNIPIVQKLTNREKEAVGRFSQFYYSFSHIDKLILENFRYERIGIIHERRTLDISLMALGAMQVNTLEVRRMGCDTSIQKTIIELISRHSIRHVTVYDHNFTIYNLCEFVCDVIKLNATMEFVQGHASGKRIYFGEDRRHWEFMQDELIWKGISINFSCCHDINFKLRSSNAHARIDVMSIEQRTSGFKYSE